MVNTKLQFARSKTVPHPLILLFILTPRPIYQEFLWSLPFYHVLLSLCHHCKPSDSQYHLSPRSLPLLPLIVLPPSSITPRSSTLNIATRWHCCDVNSIPLLRTLQRPYASLKIKGKEFPMVYKTRCNLFSTITHYHSTSPFYASFPCIPVTQPSLVEHLFLRNFAFAVPSAYNAAQVICMAYSLTPLVLLSDNTFNKLKPPHFNILQPSIYFSSCNLSLSNARWLDIYSNFYCISFQYNMRSMMAGSRFLISRYSQAYRGHSTTYWGTILKKPKQH